MGKIKKGVLGGFSGTVGSVVGGSWKGIDYIRSKPDHVKNPNTQPQRIQRGRFAGCAHFVRMLKNIVIVPIWNPVAVKMSGSNLCTQKNINCFDAEGEILNFADLTITVGPLPKPVLDIVTDSSDKKILNLSWQFNENSDGLERANDKLHMVVFDSEDSSHYARLLEINTSRKEGKFVLDLSKVDFIADDCIFHCFFYFANSDYNKFSESQYAKISTQTA